ncbi:YbaK/EbsC family protein [Aestuariirhabdus litorea]|uniref:Prolyl-tRNA synthetase associated domain-containing protein n=1 Tax=Aestuariirhabdus litorea TaxID=2528527 RepID=A0A3P3VNU3_9GAMM|nr:YbaK/EbsC family protein [Aestuariirhabdus litorea]RRJ82493.1 prolyl-tRNA synthetase associated domain-containing protein [Aestuariirhabdus litorea]RWW92654.1 prolyl-tRNA synthetase associated domain-containing protein [Endozoicomonadaceae bacterium GTF-13]
MRLDTPPVPSAERVCSDELINLLKLLQPSIRYRHHEPVFTCEQADRHAAGLAGVAAKNLLLKERKGQRYFLLCTDPSQRVDLKGLAALLGCSRLSMASAEELSLLLGTEAGALSLLSLLNDPGHRVEAIVEASLESVPRIQCHPLSNRCTMDVDTQVLWQLLDQRGHIVRWLALP